MPDSITTEKKSRRAAAIITIGWVALPCAEVTGHFLSAPSEPSPALLAERDQLLAEIERLKDT